jgi:hypothetical protein
MMQEIKQESLTAGKTKKKVARKTKVASAPTRQKEW